MRNHLRKKPITGSRPGISPNIYKHVLGIHGKRRRTKKSYLAGPLKRTRNEILHDSKVCLPGLGAPGGRSRVLPISTCSELSVLAQGRGSRSIY